MSNWSPCWPSGSLCNGSPHAPSSHEAENYEVHLQLAQRILEQPSTFVDSGSSVEEWGTSTAQATATVAGTAKNVEGANAADKDEGAAAASLAAAGVAKADIATGATKTNTSATVAPSSSDSTLLSAGNGSLSVQGVGVPWQH